MAEGVELEVANLDPKYFCHQCSREVSPFRITELICPECSTGFLEEVSRELYESTNIPECYDFDSDFGEEELSLMDGLNLDQRRLLNRMFDDEPGVESEANDTADEEVETNPFDEFVQILRDVPLDDLPHDSEDVFRVRYFDDYNADADVDALASQLLDEVEISGPPPLSKEQIKALPIVTLATEQDVNELQCTVCMNDFKVGEKAKRLTCEHLFHEKCITPWLERQASCPNCRSAVKVESKSKRSLSCPRTLNLRSRSSSSNNRRFSEVTSLGDFFTASMNPFRFL